MADLGPLSSSTTEDKPSSFESAVLHVLAIVHPAQRISVAVIRTVNEVLHSIANELLAELVRISAGQALRLLSSREIENAVSSYLPHDLAAHAIDTGRSSLATYFRPRGQGAAEDEARYSPERSDEDQPSVATNSNSNTPPTDPDQDPDDGKEYRRSIHTPTFKQRLIDGVCFPVGRVHLLIKSKLPGVKIGATCPVFLGAVLEYLCAEMLDFAGNACSDLKEPMVNIFHLKLAVANDVELKSLFMSLGNPLKFPSIPPRPENPVSPPQKQSEPIPQPAQHPVVDMDAEFSFSPKQNPGSSVPLGITKLDLSALKGSTDALHMPFPIDQSPGLPLLDPTQELPDERSLVENLKKEMTEFSLELSPVDRFERYSKMLNELMLLVQIATNSAFPPLTLPGTPTSQQTEEKRKRKRQKKNSAPALNPPTSSAATVQRVYHLRGRRKIFSESTV